jgi:hypothetical protein
MQSRRNLMKTGLAAGAFATANVAAQAADGKERRQILPCPSSSLGLCAYWASHRNSEC